MKCAVNDRRFLTDILHDVDLATVGPVNNIYVVAQQPERWPNALAVGNPDTRFKSSKRLAEFVFGEQSGRSVLTSYFIRPNKRFFESFDYQSAVLKMRICSAIGVALKFVITPTVAANIKGPLAGTNRRATGSVKLVAPHQGPSVGIV